MDRFWCEDVEFCLKKYRVIGKDHASVLAIYSRMGAVSDANDDDGTDDTDDDDTAADDADIVVSGCHS